MACRKILLTLYCRRLIKIPPAKHSSNNDFKNKSISVIDIDKSPMEGTLSDLAPVGLKLVRHTELRIIYNSFVHYYHYQQIVGAHLKYMAFINERPGACLGWNSAAWRVKSRDDFIGWDKPTKDEHLHFVVNNNRFLVLPWIFLKCLASKVLAFNVRRISDDWLNIYSHPLYMLKTFVENKRFAGTCYRPNNWTCVGQTFLLLREETLTLTRVISRMFFFIH